MKIKNFTSHLNKNLKWKAKNLQIAASISTHCARHSFATTMVKNGASMKTVGEALTHSNPESTIGYFAGFKEKNKKEIIKYLLSVI